MAITGLCTVRQPYLVQFESRQPAPVGTPSFRTPGLDRMVPRIAGPPLKLIVEALFKMDTFLGHARSKPNRTLRNSERIGSAEAWQSETLSGLFE